MCIAGDCPGICAGEALQCCELSWAIAARDSPRAQAPEDKRGKGAHCGDNGRGCVWNKSLEIMRLGNSADGYVPLLMADSWQES